MPSPGWRVTTRAIINTKEEDDGPDAVRAAIRRCRRKSETFIRQHGDKSPKVGGGRKRPDQKTLDWQKRLVEHGYAGRTIPREYGGFGATPDVMAAAVIAGEFARANIYAGLTNQGISMLVPTLLELGTEEQKREYVGPTIRGDIIWCQGYSEPGNGSDLANAQTKAELRDGNWIVNGQKIWTSSAHYADMMFLLCRTEPDKPKHDGLSYLLLSMKSPGLEARPLKTMTGRSEFNEVFFTDVKVPESTDRAGPRQGLVRRQRHAEARAPDDRRCRQDDRAPGTTDYPAANIGNRRRQADRHGRISRPAAAPAGRGAGLEGA